MTPLQTAVQTAINDLDTHLLLPHMAGSTICVRISEIRTHLRDALKSALEADAQVSGAEGLTQTVLATQLLTAVRKDQLQDIVSFDFGADKINDGAVADWLRMVAKTLQRENPVVTCVYCGQKYPEGTPTHQQKVLTEHISKCDKHPLRAAEARIVELERKLTLVRLIIPTIMDHAPQHVLRDYLGDLTACVKDFVVDAQVTEQPSTEELTKPTETMPIVGRSTVRVTQHFRFYRDAEDKFEDSVATIVALLLNGKVVGPILESLDFMRPGDEVAIDTWARKNVGLGEGDSLFKRSAAPLEVPAKDRTGGDAMRYFREHSEQSFIHKAGDQPPKRRIHELKTDPAVFDDLVAGRKTFEIRRNDRNYHVGDTLVLRKTRYTGAEMAAGAELTYTGEETSRVVTSILRGPTYGLAEGWVIMSTAHQPENAIHHV